MSGLRPQSSLRGRPALAKIVREFADVLPALASEVRAQLDAGALEPARRLAHRLKGSAGGYGFPDVMRVAAAIEAFAASGDAADAARLGPELEAQCRRARAEVIAGADPA